MPYTGNRTIMYHHKVDFCVGAGDATCLPTHTIIQQALYPSRKHRNFAHYLNCMILNALLHRLALLTAGLMVACGMALGVWVAGHLPSRPGLERDALAAEQTQPKTTAPADRAQADRTQEAPAAHDLSTTQLNQRATTAALDNDAADATTLTVGGAAVLPADLQQAFGELHVGAAQIVTTTGSDAVAQVLLGWDDGAGEPVYRQVFAAATRFDAIDLNVRMLHIRRAWQGDTQRFDQVVVLRESVPALQSILGEAGNQVVVVDDMAALQEETMASRDMLALVPFDRLVPHLAVFSVDGQTPVENAAKFNPTAYPLVAVLYATPGDAGSSGDVARLAAAMPATNREPSRLTVVAMTGVTAMVRLTAAEMDKRGPAWPAEVVGPELATADITAISNEVPFVPDCETNTDRENLVFCSKPDYMETLRASGTDIVGLTGNHQNDYGFEDAMTSLEIYADEGLPVYGGGADRTAAFAPLIIEHNGNRLAFLGANSYGPPSAWATDFSPGSAPFDLAVMSATIRELKAESADVVFTEMQYQESYGVEPLLDQRLDFGALARAGADIVTGVQSHVPQGIEFVEGNMVLYGLGNLYFDQMWTEETREGLIVKHTIYKGRHISTQLLPTLLYDYGQPRWPDAERRAAILAKVFAASNWE